ncbi:MAG: fimbria major subunit [Muribaculaceae bacterium]|nr:fimbria major subunit [Muribaculaceae bacterium]
MKLFKYCLPFAALALLASCSDNNIDAPAGGEQAPEVEGDAMFLSVNVGLPTSAGTKAPSLGDYDPGTTNEYAINDITLYVFEWDGTGTPEKNATYFDTADLGYSLDEDAPEKSDITETYKATFQISSIKLQAGDEGLETVNGKDYYGLLVVNKPTNFTAPSTGTFADWNKTPIVSASTGSDATDVMITNGYFFMSNAPQADDETASILVKLDVSKFATSPKLATAAAAQFYVQRGVAKLTIKAEGEDGFEGIQVKDGPLTTDVTDDTVDITAWALDLTNEAEFYVQNVDDYTSSWFGIGEAADDNYFIAQKGSQGLIDHIWWGIDPNYSKYQTGSGTSYEDNLNKITTTELVENDPEETTSAYLLENTTKYDNMLKSNVTRVIFKATYNINGEAPDLNTYSGFAVYNDKAYPVETNDLKEGLTPAGQKYALQDLIKTDDDNETLEKYRSALAMGNYTQEVLFYPSFETYYVAYVRHFNDDETPLTDGQKADLSALNTTDNNYNENQTGRYGILRNNSYVMNIKAVFGFGTPTIPPTPDDPVDKEDPTKYNAIVEMNILNWAVRESNYIPR